jgi:hypothetical protein
VERSRRRDRQARQPHRLHLPAQVRTSMSGHQIRPFCRYISRMRSVIAATWRERSCLR